MSKLTDDLLDRGYRYSTSSSYEIFRRTKHLYQKRVEDSKGIKYHINGWHYPERSYYVMPYEGIQFEVQFTWGENYVDVSPLIDDVEKAEAFFETMWENMGFGYYEENDYGEKDE